ncbi:MAG: hypothetical protein K8S97_15715 [Anaerolineae bacterium]|nr:hypothetical protein [Anaerolineae bacterium]
MPDRKAWIVLIVFMAVLAPVAIYLLITYQPGEGQRILWALRCLPMSFRIVYVNNHFGTLQRKTHTLTRKARLN